MQVLPMCGFYNQDDVSWSLLNLKGLEFRCKITEEVNFIVLTIKQVNKPLPVSFYN